MELVGATRYLELMKEIKQRTLVVHRLLVGEASTGFMQTNVEVIYLQYRKILELIAFGSLVANVNAYAKARKSYAREWRAKQILNAVEAVHPHFYPNPVTQRRKKDKIHTVELHEFKGSYLSRGDFERLYDACGDILHSNNPYGSPYEYQKYRDAAPEWALKIRNLLTVHAVQLFNQKQFYLIQMGSSSSDPTYTLFQRFDEENIPDFSHGQGSVID